MTPRGPSEDEQVMSLRAYVFKIGGFSLLFVGVAQFPVESIAGLLFADPLYLQVVSTFILKIKSFVTWAGISVLFSCFLVLFLKEVFGFVWSGVLESQCNNFTSSVDSNLKEMNAKVSNITENFEKYIKNRGGPLSLVECRDREDFKDYIKFAHSQVYGSHISHPASFSSYITDRILESFCCAPHRSQVEKHINVSLYPENPKYVKWHEITTFKIHHILFASNPTQGVFDVGFYLRSFSTDLEPEQWAKVVRVNILVNGVPIVGPSHKPTFEKNYSDAGYFCWKEGNWIFLRYDEPLILEGEWTDVRIEEHSINSIDDTNYTVNSNKPVCRHTINFDLPPEFVFIKNPFVSASILNRGLSADVRKRHDIDELLKINQNSENHMRIEVNDWMLPGILMIVNWRETPETEEAELDSSASSV